MACYKPLRAYRGGRGITFVRSLSLTGVSFELPCGQCIGCRLERSRQWAMRCMHERRLHRENCFVTLTYATEHLPPGGTLVKRDLQLFMKRLRKARGNGIRFYACGEYGELNRRPHYHAILFNVDFPDKLVSGRNGRGDTYFVSALLDKLWSLGACQLGEVTFDSAAYVARYVMKKVTGDDAAAHYCVRDGDGVVYDREPEFAVMSRRPGIGAGYYERYGTEVRAHDAVVINGREVRPPRFYDTRTEAVDPERLAVLKRQRRRAATLAKPDNIPARRAVKEEVVRRQLAQKGRTL